MKMAPKKQNKTVDYSGLSPAELVALLQEKEAELHAKDSIISHVSKERDAAVADRDKYKAITDELLRLAKIKHFGASSEKESRSEKGSVQYHLFDEAELEAAIDDIRDQLPEDDVDADKVTPSSKKRTRQRGFSASLNRIRKELTLSDDDKAGATSTFFTKVKEELEYIPAQLNVVEIWQEKAVFATNEGDCIVAAQRPVHPLGKCIATTMLLAYIIVSKYADGLPLYRLNNILVRLGYDIGRSNMANWIIRLDDVFKPLIHLMREQQNQACYIQADETRIQVLKEDGKTAQSDKWMWVTRGGPPDKPTVLFEYDPSRAGDVPLRLLDGFTGVLQVDGYAGYGKVCRSMGIVRIGCWDHARRKFVEASNAAPANKKKAKKGQPSKADVALSKIRKLYAIEGKIQDLSDEEKYRARQELSIPVLEEIKTWLEANLSKVLKGSLTYKAISYALGQWDSLMAYCDYGFVNISNALAENAIRPFAVGRRNWLFADTARGARASATCYSLIETAKVNGLEPSAYITYVLDNIAEATTVEQLEALLPWNMPQAN